MTEFNTTDPKAQASLFKKIAVVTGKLRNIKKDKRHQQGWEYSSWEAISTAINFQLGEAGLAFLPEVSGPIEETVVGKTGGGANIIRYKVPMRMTLADGDTGAYISLAWVAISDDFSDKGVEKAYTFGCKGFLKKLFVIGTGDDPDGESNNYDYGDGNQSSEQPARQEPPPPPALVPSPSKAPRSASQEVPKAEPEPAKPKPEDVRKQRAEAAIDAIQSENKRVCVLLGVSAFDLDKLLNRVGVKDHHDPDQLESAIEPVKRYLGLQVAITKMQPKENALNAAEWSAGCVQRMKNLNLVWDPKGTPKDDQMILDTLRNDLFPPPLPEAAAEEDFNLAALESIVGSDDDDDEEADSLLEDLGGFKAF